MYTTNQTSRFYEPLRTTLDKSMVRDPKMQLAKSRMFDQVGATSRISRRMRSLSPQQANYIKSSTYIPVDRQLVPTANLWKVQGKQFTAVNVQVKQGQPIPAEQMVIQPGMRGGMITSETVYQLMPKQSQIRSIGNTRSITNLRTVYPPPPIQTIQRNTIQVPITNRYTVVEQRRPASQVRILTQPTLPQSNSRVIQPVIPINVRNNISDHRYEQKVENPPVEATGNKSNYYSSQYYNQLKPTNLQNTNKKNKYKYNFFSAIDQAINTKCGSCGANELIASKPLSSWQ